jgi:hypothetical protein
MLYQFSINDSYLSSISCILVVEFRYVKEGIFHVRVGFLPYFLSILHYLHIDIQKNIRQHKSFYERENPKFTNKCLILHVDHSNSTKIKLCLDASLF